jgi:DNA-binding response OmpR family regulator
MELQIILALKAGQAKRLTVDNPDALIVDYDRKAFWRDGAFIRLEPSKFMLVFLIASRVGALVSKEELCDALWGDEEDGGPDTQWKVIDVQLCKIRKVLPSLGVWIETVHGRGYRFVARDGSVEHALRRAA